MKKTPRSQFLPPLLGIFLAVFDDSKGALILDDHPPRCSTLTTLQPQDAQQTHETTFVDVASDWIIPRKPLCGHLVTICFANNKCLGEPQWIEDPDKYERGHFIFNLCFLFHRDAELAAYEPLVKKAARLFSQLERSSSLLSNLPAHSNRFQSILRQLYLDLNTHSYSSIYLDNTHTLNLRLFPIYPNPKPITDWEVPLLLVHLHSAIDDSWDITMARIAPFIDGIATVKRIAKLADVDYALAREAIQHLVYYSCAVMLDLFAYSNSYTLVDGAMDSLVQLSGSKKRRDAKLRREIEKFTSVNGRRRVPFTTLFRLYARLRPTISLNDWMEENSVHELGIDVRRMMVIGVIKGFIRRIRCYPIWLDHPNLTRRQDPPPASQIITLPSSASPSSTTVTGVTASTTTPTSTVTSTAPISHSPLIHHRSHPPHLYSYRPASSPPDIYSVSPPLPSAVPSVHSQISQQQQQQQSSYNARMFSTSPQSNMSLLSTPSIHTAAMMNPFNSIPVSQVQSQSHTQSHTQQPPTPQQQQQPPSTQSQSQHHPIPSSLPLLLDGEHDTDELCVKYKISFSRLEQELAFIGGVTANNSLPSNGNSNNNNNNNPSSSTSVPTLSDRSSGDYGRVQLIWE